MPVTLTISDPDQASGVAHTIRIDMYAATTAARCTTTASRSRPAVHRRQAKLSYSHDGSDLNGGFPPNETFQITVTDDGGGEGSGHGKSVQQTVTLTINRVNDDPRLLTNDPLTVNGAIVIDRPCPVTDPDSVRAEPDLHADRYHRACAWRTAEAERRAPDAGASSRSSTSTTARCATSGTAARRPTPSPILAFHGEGTARLGVLLGIDCACTREGGITECQRSEGGLSVHVHDQQQPLSRPAERQQRSDQPPAAHIARQYRLREPQIWHGLPHDHACRPELTDTDNTSDEIETTACLTCHLAAAGFTFRQEVDIDR